MPTAATPPARIAAGDTVSFAFSHADYPASAGWAMAWRLVGTGVALTLTATASGDAFTVAATATATAALTVAAAGVPCTLMGYASRAGERFEAYRAPCLLLPNPATITGDLRGHAARTLEAINALLEGRATKDQESYRIGDRELSRIPVPELLALRDYYRAEARREDAAALVASGMPGRPRQVLTRMVRA
jgi:hypothetical protein